MSENHSIDGITLHEWQEVVRVMLQDDGFLSVIEVLFKACKDGIGAKAGYVALIYDGGSEKEIVYRDRDECGSDPELETSMLNLVLQDEIYLSGRARYYNDFNQSDSKKYISSDHITLNNLLFAPLTAGGMPRGLIALSNKDGGFIDQDVCTVEHYGKLITWALLNSWNNGIQDSNEKKCCELIERAYDAIVSLNDDNDITFANKAFYEMFPHQGDSLGKKITEIIGHCEFPHLEGLHSLSTLTAEGQDHSLELSLSTIAIGEKGVKTVVIRDVSEEKVHEKMMRLIGRKIELMGKITRHDVMNHIMVLQGYLELSYDAGVPVSDKYYSRMEGALEKIKALFSLQREFEGLGSSESEWINVKDTLSRAQGLMAGGTESITFQVDTEISLWADNLLEKVFYNLLHNSSVHGERVSRITLKSEIRNEELLLDFIDDGVGIPTGEKESIFSLGYGKLSGQGLFLVKEILATYNMGIEEIGEPGKGAVFRISVPRGCWIDN